MNRLEAASPGVKAQFFLGHLDRAASLFGSQERAEPSRCERCGQPTTSRFCAFCRVQAQILGRRLDRIPEDTAADDRQVARSLSEEVLPVELYGAPRGSG